MGGFANMFQVPMAIGIKYFAPESFWQMTGANIADYADLDITTTLSGYNPLIDDFTNTRVFVASSSHKKV